MLLGLRGSTDWLLHFSGGVAITAFLWSIAPLATRWLGEIAQKWSLVIVFSGGCTIALFWDLAEFASDEILGTDVQHSLRETMLDLTYGVAGVSVATATILIRLLR